MSSAAVQPSTAAISSRQQQQYSVSRDQYYQPSSQQQQQLQAHPSSSNARKQAARSSNANSPNTPTLPQHPSPTVSNTSNMTTPRALPPMPSGTTSSPITSSTVTAVPRGRSNSPVVPPRTSSHRQSPSVSTPPHDNLSLSSPRAQSNSTFDQQTASASSKRRAHSSKDPSGSRDKSGRSDAGSSRPQISEDLPREDSVVIQKDVISDLSEDLVREQQRMAESRPLPPGSDPTSPELTLVGSEGVEDGGRGAGKSRERGERRKVTTFGDYILGQTLGEGEFGKVKMGWKRDSSIQVAIKLIRRDQLGDRSGSRMPKVLREINILRGLSHPNIVRLHEMVETERHIGIILEYASGGELFDYILQHRYLKDNAARRLFAQLVSGVGYLHKKGIVHRDLKLENLLLDRHRNIIITDFGFANTFSPQDELGDNIEYRLADKDFIKKYGLDRLGPDGHRRGDLMQTSCGSPCYAAPELVVSDSLYTGRKVDVWSCGVILYAMLAGYLPFDDDPANPEGDNINLLYKYIVSTPLTFPEYVTPHARDLLKRILVPDPRKRADLFEVARHSWLNEYAHVVALITSSTTTENQAASATVPSANAYEVPSLARSASVREPPKSHVPSAVGGLVQKQGTVDPAAQDKGKPSREAKRRTVQVEYVAPQSQTAREGKTKARAEGPVEVIEDYQRRSHVPSSSMAPPPRPAREQPRAASETVAQTSAGGSYGERPSTGGSIQGGHVRNGRLPSRGNSYGQPAVGVSQEEAQGRFSNPTLDAYNTSAPLPRETTARPDRRSYIDPSTGGFDAQTGYPEIVKGQDPRRSHGGGHRRSNTVSGISEKLFGFSKRGSLFGSKDKSGGDKDKASIDEDEKPRKPKKSYPPVSMKSPIPNDNPPVEPRKSSESRRTSFSFSRKSSANVPNGYSDESKRSSRRFSFIPSFSRHDKEKSSEQLNVQPIRGDRIDRPRMAFGRGDSRSPSRSTTASSIPVNYNADIDRQRDLPTRTRNQPAMTQYPEYPTQPLQYPSHADNYNNHRNDHRDSLSTPTPPAVSSHNPGPYSDDQQHNVLPGQQPVHSPQYPPGFNAYEDEYRPSTKHSVLTKQRRNFNEAYDEPGRHEGSSGAARRVMDFFRKRGKARGGD